jgi:CHAT domain-containing protein
MAAGADSLLVSHWNVDSQAARDVVSAFFDLKSTLSSAEALNAAKQRIKNQARPMGMQTDGLKMSQSHPFFWAPFIFVGVEQTHPAEAK